MFTEKINPNDRFEYLYSQDGMCRVKILVDKMTGVNYLMTETGVTVMLNADGTPVMTPLEGTW